MATIVNKYYGSQKGFTLIELMIGMVLGIFVIGGIYTVLVGNTNAYTVVKSTTTLHEDARSGILYLRQQFHMAGWRSEVDISTSEKDYSGGTITFDSEGDFVEEQILFGRDGANDESNDEIVIRFRGTTVQDAPFDCTGQAVTAGTATVQFSVNNAQQLECTVITVPVPATTPPIKGIVLDNVELFKIQYFDGSKFVNAAAATADDNFKNIVALRFAIMLKGEKNAKQAFSQKHYIFGKEVTFNDNIVREVFQETVRLHNVH